MIPNTFIEFYGDQTRWFLGRVVNIYDPRYLGRIRVKIFGVHDNIADVDLPWAQTVVPITQGGTQGYGNNIGIQKGAQVFGVFLDGRSSQMPLVLGSIPRVENQDEEHTTNTLAYNTSGKKRHRETDFPLLDEISIRNELVKLRKEVKYPHNKVYETEGVDGKTGHIKEYDDTAGYERIHERHSSGTFYQMGPSGELVTSVKGNDYKIAHKESFLEVNNNRYTTIHQDDKLIVNGNVTIQVRKDDEKDVEKGVEKGNVTIQVENNVTIQVGNNATIDVTGDAKVTSKKSIDLTAPEVTVRGNTIKLNS
jgi:hypothetical protein